MDNPNVVRIPSEVSAVSIHVAVKTTSKLISVCTVEPVCDSVIIQKAHKKQQNKKQITQEPTRVWR